MNKITSTRVQLTVILLVTALIPLMIFGWVNLDRTIKIETVQAEDSLKSTVLSNEEALENYLENTEAIAESISNTEIIQKYIYYLDKNLNDSEREEFEFVKAQADDLIKSVMEVHWGKYHHIYIANKSAEIVLSPDHGNEEKGSPSSHFGSNLSDVSWFNEALQETQVTDFSSLVESDHFHQLLMFPLKDSSGQSKGVIAFELMISYERELLAKHLNLGNTGNVYLVALDGTPVVHLRDDASFKIETIGIEKAIENGHYSGKSINSEGVEVHGFYLKNSKYPWILVAEIESSEVLKNIKDIQFFFAVSLLLTFIVVLVLSSLMSNFFTKPIHKLHEATKRIMLEDYDVRVDVKTGNELEELADAFNKTASALGELDEKRKEIDSTKNKLLSVTSHELQSPLTPIKGQLQMLDKEYFGKLNIEQKASTGMIKNNFEHLGGIILKFVNMSRIMAKRISFNFVKTDLAAHVKQLVDKFLKNIKVKMTVNIGKLPLVELDQNHFTTVMTNLLENAVKFSEKDPVVVINAEVKGDFVEFSVKDNGIGMSAEVQKKIFKPFYQGEESMYRKFGGPGLGLAVCKGLVDVQGGKIWFESEVGKGSVFHFTIPLKPVKKNN